MGEAFFITRDNILFVDSLDDIAECVRKEDIRSVDALISVFRMYDDMRVYGRTRNVGFSIYAPEPSLTSAVDEYYLTLDVRADINLCFSLNRPIAEVELVPNGGLVPAQSRPSDLSLVPANPHFHFMRDSQLLAQFMKIYNATGHNPSMTICYEDDVFFPLDMEKIAEDTIMEQRERRWTSNPEKTMLVGYHSPFRS